MIDTKLREISRLVGWVMGLVSTTIVVRKLNREKFKMASQALREAADKIEELLE